MRKATTNGKWEISGREQEVDNVEFWTLKENRKRRKHEDEHERARAWNKKRWLWKIKCYLRREGVNVQLVGARRFYARGALEKNGVDLNV